MMAKQNTLKPKIEEIVSDYLDGDALGNAMDFFAWLRANKMTPTFGSKSKIGISYTTRVCYIKLFHGSWYIWPAGKKGVYANDFLVCEELSERVSASLAPCKGCGHQCNSGLGFTKTVCGKEFEHLCGCCPVRFHNPDAEALTIIKNVIEKRDRAKGHHDAG